MTMTPQSLFPEILATFVYQIPVLLVGGVACVLMLTDWRRNARVSLWALLGFGLAVFLCFAVPLAQAVARQVVMANGGSASAMGSVFAGLAVVWAIFRAATYLFLLLAVLAGRAAGVSPERPR